MRSNLYLRNNDFPKEILILDHIRIEVIVIIHHLLHRFIITGVCDPVKVTKEKQVDTVFGQVFLRKFFGIQFRPARKDCKNQRKQTKKKQNNQRNYQFFFRKRITDHRCQWLS